jgi:membrane-associated PAP2 superfamily phosphatase
MRFNTAVLALGAGAMAIILLGMTDADMLLARAMAGNGPIPFPLRHHWFAETLAHGYLKNVMIALGACAVLPALADLWRRQVGWSARFRLRLRLLALAAVLVPLEVALLKQASSSHCPWDLIQFGGTETYVRLFEPAVTGAQAGHCMPAGHASAGLWLVALAVFWLPERPRRAAAVAVAALGVGLAMGVIQQLRGAHFLSHTLWSMWIACATVTVLWHLMYREQIESEMRFRA